VILRTFLAVPGVLGGGHAELGQSHRLTTSRPGPIIAS
jgi:hypothetical protein